MSKTLDILDCKGARVGEYVIPDTALEMEKGEQAVRDAVVAFLAEMRAGTASTKTRGEVSGGGAKPFRQKGTGRARAGSSRSPIWLGGGVIFGPKPRSYAKKMNRKARRLALCCALSAKVAANELVVIDGLTFDAPKTKNVVAMLNAFEAATAKALLITNGCENVELSARNMPKVTTITNMGLNCFDILHANKVFLAKEVVEKIEEVLA